MSITINEEMIKSLSLKDIEMIREVSPTIEFNYWLQNALFTWQWWFLLITTIIPWIIWWKKVDKTRFFEITTLWFLVGCSCGSFR